MSVPQIAVRPRTPALERFLRYVRIDTQSAEAQSNVPSTPGQWDLARLLAAELTELGAADVRLSDSCILYATIPGTLADPAGVPAVGFIAHLDTSPAVSGANVTPIVHTGYEGGDLVLPGDPTQVIRVAEHPALARLVGDDIVTADGTTLLGSDDKAGIAAIMTMADVLLASPDVPHGEIAIAFTADEEVGVGIDRFDIRGFGARFAYTVDGDELGEINHETWSARGATVTFDGVSAHPGSAKGRMVNSLHAMVDFLTSLPPELRPEATDGRDGFIHAYNGVIDTERSIVKIILRDFEAAGLDDKQALVERLVRDAAARLPGAGADVRFEDQYRNMNEVLRDHPQLVAFALEAAGRAGLTARTRPIRGGTDGAKLTFRGLPCPNIFTGGHNFHSRLEFNSRRGLDKTTETLVHLVRIFAEHPGAFD